MRRHRAFSRRRWCGWKTTTDIEKDRWHLRQAVGTQVRTPLALQAGRGIVYAQAEQINSSCSSKTLLNPVTFLATGFNAGLDQAEDSDPSYGQGAEGYGRRFGAEFAGQASSTFFKDFAYPWIFRRTPLLPPGPRPPRTRLLHAWSTR